jgi:hypothetical protein
VIVSLYDAPMTIAIGLAEIRGLEAIDAIAICDRLDEYRCTTASAARWRCAAATLRPLVVISKPRWRSCETRRSAAS